MINCIIGSFIGATLAILINLLMVRKIINTYEEICNGEIIFSTEYKIKKDEI